MFIFADFNLIFGAEGKIQKFRNLRNFAGYTVPTKFRNLHYYRLLFFYFSCTVHVFVFCDIYINCFFNSQNVFKIKNKKFARLRIFATSLQFCSQFCFDHNFFIRTLVWVILVPLESLESVESKYSQKKTLLKLL